MIMPLRRGIPDRFVVTGKLNPATEPGDAIANQAINAETESVSYGKAYELKNW